MTSARVARAALVALACLAGAPAARAASSADDERRADELFRRAQKLLAAGSVHDACTTFAESQALDPAIGTLLNLADCHAQERRTATARAEYAQAAQLAARAGQHEREQFARRQVRELDAILSLVQVRLPPGAAIDEATVDGARVDLASLASPLPLDPGRHVLRFAASGRGERTVSVDVALGPSTVVLEVPPIEPAAPEPASPAAEPPAPDAGGTRRTIALAVAAAGIVGVGVGSYFGLVAASKKSDGDAHCSGPYCDPAGLALQDDAHAAATASTLAFGVGLVALGVGALLYFTAPRRAASTLALDEHGRARLGVRW